LHAARRRQLVKFPVELIERNDIMIVVFFGAIKSAELAIDVADVGVIDVAVDDVGDDLVAPPVVGRALALAPARVACSRR
jgi:hypothetical protein